MALKRQLSMLPDQVPDKLLGDNRDKILELYHRMPEIADSDKVLILAFWATYDDLPIVLGEHYSAFCKWLLQKSTKTESIRRPRQSLTEHGLIHHTHHTAKGVMQHAHPKAQDDEKHANWDDNREWLEAAYRRYWGQYR